MHATRMYASHRRAWTPRLAPMVVATSAFVFALDLLLSPGVIAAVVIGFGVAVVVGNLRWAIWRRRHPVISVDEYVTDLVRERRRNARWN